MNAEQLNAVCRELKREIESNKLVQKLQQLESALGSTVNQPGQAQHQQEVRTHREALKEVLEKIEAENRPVSKKLIISELGADRVLGEGLLDRIEDSFTQVDVTPSVVHSDVTAMRQELEELLAGLDHLINGFDRFGIGMDELDPYAAELGVLIPRRKESTRLQGLASDLRHLDKELRVFQELATGDSRNFEVRSISSSDFQFFLDLLPETGAAIASAIAALTLAYDKLLDIRLKRKQLADNDAPVEVTTEIDKWAERIMADAIDKLTDEFIDKYSEIDRADGREHELRTALRISLKQISARLDVGYHFSVRVGPLPDQSEEEDEEGADERERKAAVVQAIKEDGSRIEHRALPGDPVLPLEWRPEADEDDGDN